MASAHDFSFTGIDGKKLHLRDYAGKPVLVVNVASFCGFTPQYSELQKLHETYGPKGLVVLAVPSNDFGAQEPKTEAEIRKFCESSFGVSFPMTAKQTVAGLDAHDLYKWFSGEAGEAVAPKWNFHKYLINKDGTIAGTFGPRTTPDDAAMNAEIDKALAK